MRLSLINVKESISLKFILLFFLMCAALVNQAATYYSRATGNWNVNTTWSLTSGGPAVGVGVFPVAGDDVFIEGGRTVTVNIASACANVSIAAGSTLTIGGFNFTVSSSTTITGTLSATSVTGTKSLGAVLFNGGTFNNSSTGNTFAITTLTLSNSTISGTRTAIFTVSGAMTVTTGTSNNIGNITLNIAGLTTVNGTAIFSNTGGNKNFNGGLTVSNGTITSNVGETYTISNLILSNATLNSTAATPIDGRFTVSGTMTVSAGTITTVNPATFTVTGATNIDGTMTVSSTTGSRTHIGLVTIGSNGNWNFTVNEPVVLRGGLTNNGTFTSGAGTYTFNTNSQSLSGTQPITFSGAVAITGVITITNTTTVTIAGNLTGSVAGSTWTNGANSVLNAGNAVLTTAGTILNASASGNTVNYNRAGNQTVKPTTYHHLSLGGTGTKTLTGLTTVNGNFTTSSTGTLTATTAAGLTIGGNLDIGAGSTLTVGGFAFTVNGTTTISGTHPHTGVAGLKTYVGDVTVNGGGIWSNASNSAFTFQGSLINNGTLTAGTGIYNFNGSSKYLSGTSGLTIQNTTIAGSYTNQTTLTVATALSGGGSLTQDSNATLNIGGTSAITTLQASATGNTVNYTGAGQTVKEVNYYHLILSGSGTKIMPAISFTVAGNFTTTGTISATARNNIAINGHVTLGSGTTFNASSFSHTVGGNWSNNGATFTASSSMFTFNGTSSQNIGGSVPTSFYDITINNGSGVILGNAINAEGVTLTNGLATTTSANLLTVTGTSPTAITGSSSSYINGPLAWTIPASLTNGNYLFPVGKSGYNTIEFVNMNTGAGGNVIIQAEVFDGDCGGTPGIGMSTLNTNHFWNASFISGGGNFLNTLVRLTEGGLDGDDAIGQCATQTGSYDRISNTAPSGGTIISDAITTLGYFATGKKPIVTIEAIQDGTEGGADGLFRLTTTRQFTIDRSINITIGGTSTNGTDYTTINTSVNFPAFQNTADITVAVTDDASVEPSETVIITLQDGTGYGLGTPLEATINIFDNDAAVITVSPTSGLTTTENLGQATFTIVLSSQPTADVSIGLSSNDLTEGTVSPSSVTFTSGNWNTAQTITITGVNDFLDDGDIAYTIVTAAATSGDANYSGLNAADVSVTNTDNDVSGITVNPSGGLTTTEAGGQATFTIVLTAQPTANVSIGLSSDDATEGTVSPASVTFTSGNWNTAQTITITGVNDFIVDGSVAYNIVTAAANSTDANYNGLDASDVSVSNTDNDIAGIIVNPTSGLNTSEAGGQATFTIVLNSQPSADVTIGLSSDNTDEGTVSPASVTFTNGNWNSAQTITITGVDDLIDDGNIAYTIITATASSSDGNYNGINPSDVSVTNADNDNAGITVNPTNGLTTTEAGGTTTFSVVLNTQPNNDVSIDLSSSDISEGTISSATITFTDANWNIPQNLTITGVNDDVDDGNIAYSIITAAASSADPIYNGLNPADVSVSNTDDDVAGITVTPTSGLVTTEGGGTVTFTVKLNSEPTDNVTIGISSNDLTEGTVSPLGLTFTPLNWNSEQTVTVTGVNDDIDDGDIAYTVVTAAAISTDGLYNSMNAADVSITNSNDDTAGITVNPTSGLTTTEAGGTAGFTIVLNSQPTANVVIDVSSSDPTEGTVSPVIITFTSGNWNIAQTITVTGVNDNIMDGDIAFTILTSVEPGADLLYSAIDPNDVSVTNSDNDIAGITVNPISGLTTTEAGGTATFTVKLNSEPTANVVIGISSNDLTEGTASPSGLTFTSLNWNTTQTVTITGVNDLVQDGNIAYSIITAAAVSSDGNYSGMNASDVSVTNNDNDVAGITVSPTTGLTTTEGGATASFTVVLTSQPTADVTIGIASSDLTEGTVSLSSVTFSTANWNVARNVVVTGVDDYSIDGNIGYSIVTAAATSADGIYNGMNASDVSVTNTDNDVASVIVSPTSGLSSGEDGSSDIFTIELSTIPTADVTINLSTSDATEGTVSPSSVVLNSSNWNIPQSVTITGVDDFVQDGDISYSIVTAAATSSDSYYNGINPSDVSVINQDDDIADIVVTPTSGLETSENLTSATFTIVLTSQPTANVTIGLSVDDNSEGTISPSSVTFTAANWSTPQTITVTGKNDNQNDGDIPYNAITAAATSTDPVYSGMNADDVSVTNLDNDSPAISVTPTSGLITTEAAATATFTVVLGTQPTDDVSIPVSSNDLTEGTVSTSTLTFTAANWNSAQTVTITGVNDALVDGNIPYAIILGVATSNDNDYDGMDPADVSVTNTDLTPTISNFSPSAVCYGSGASITINGTFFTGTTSVLINGVSSTYAVNSATQITATLPATSTTGTLSVITPTGTAVSSSSLTVDPVTVGGSISGGTTVCPYSNSTTLTLSGYTGNIINWQSSPDGSSWTDFSNTSNTYISTNIVSTTHYRAVLKSGSCNVAYSSSAVVTVQDNTNPVVSVTNDTIVQIIVNPGDAPAFVNVLSQSTTIFSDNCLVSVKNNYNNSTDASDTYPLGETLVTWTARDSSGNSASALQRVFVAASAGLAIICPPDQDLGCNPSSFPLGTPSYNEHWPWVRVSTGNDHPGTETGGPCNYTRTVKFWAEWKVFGLFGSVKDTCEQHFTYIKDTTNPIISCTNNKAVNSNASSCRYQHGDDSWNANASDNCTLSTLSYVLTGVTTGSGTTLNGVFFNAGITTVTWTATDACGNTATCFYTVTVRSITASISIQQGNNECPELLVAKGYNPDNDGPYNTGATEIIYRVSIQNSSASSWEFIYEVQDATIDISSPEDQSGTISNITENYYDLHFYIVNMPGNAISPKLIITTLSDMNGCTDTTDREETIHVLSMPVIGPFE